MDPSSEYSAAARVYVESFKDVWFMMEEAMKSPPLQEEDFVQPKETSDEEE